MSKLPRKLSDIQSDESSTKQKNRKKSVKKTSSKNETNERKITKITTQKKKGRYNVFLDGEYAFPVDESILIKYMLAKDMVVSTELQTRIESEDMVQKAYQQALNYLNHRLRSEKQVKDYLIDKEYELQADAAIEKLKEQNLINDLEFAKSYVRTAALINRKGPKQIQRDLTKYGINEYDQLDALEEYPKDQQLENAVHLGNKKIKSSKRKSSKETQNKIRQYLMQKGYDREIIDETLRELDTEKSTDEEWQALLKQGQKAWKRYSRKSDGSELRQKVKANLYQKRFPSELINKFVEEMEENNERY